jgi:hypothetical protein
VATSLPSLAELDDVEDRLGRDLTEEEQRRAQAMLDDASAVVRAYTRRNFTRSTETVRLRPRGNKVVLPQRPVISVDALSTVVSFGPTEIVTATPSWSFPAGSEIYFLDNAEIFNSPTLDNADENLWVEVTYTYGYDDIPYDIMAVVANMVVRNLTVPNGGTVDLETVGPYTVRYSGFTSAGPLALSPADRDILNRYRVATAYTMELRP